MNSEENEKETNFVDRDQKKKKLKKQQKYKKSRKVKLEKD